MNARFLESAALALFIVVLCAATELMCQSPSIAGRVWDRAAHPLPGISVTAITESGGTLVRTTSAQDGTFTFAGLPGGTYRVDFEVLGFDITRVNHVRVQEAATAPVEAILDASSICECINQLPPVPLQERSGRVVDESDRPLPHARLDLSSPGRHETAYADGEGRFRVRLPVEGTWPLLASDTGLDFTTLQVSGTGAEILFKLKPSHNAKAASRERFNRACRCPGDLFTHPER